MPICPVCDEQNGDKNMFCINCGEELIRMDFARPREAPPRRRSPRVAPAIRAVAPVSVTAPPASTPDPFTGLPKTKLPTTEPAPAFPDVTSAPPQEPSKADPFSTGDNRLSFPEDEPAAASQAEPASPPVPFPEVDDAPPTDAPPFPEDDAPAVDAPAAVPFPEEDDGEPVPDAVQSPFPGEDRSLTPAKPDPDTTVPFPTDETPEDAPRTGAVPFPEDDDGDAPATANAAPLPFPEDDDGSRSDEAPAPATDESDAHPFPEDNDETPSPLLSASPTPFPDDINETGAAEGDDAKTPPKKIPGKPATGTQIHQSISVGPPPSQSRAPASPGSGRPNTSDALPRPKPPQTTVPAPVHWYSECEMCGFHNEPDAVYCGECGTAIKKKNFSESTVAGRAKLVQVSFDGGETQVFDIDEHGLAISAITGDITPISDYDPLAHALFRIAGGTIRLTPPKGENGIFVRIPPKKPTDIDTGSVIRIGHQTMLFEAGTHQYQAWATLTLKPPSPNPRVISLEAEDTLVGRETGHIQFSDDYLVSGTHMRIYTTDGRYLIYDMASTNGTYLQVNTPYHPVPGEVFIIASKIYKTSLD